MTLQDREQKALDAYLKLIGSKGAAPDNLARRKALLEHVLPGLAGQPADGATYRQIIDELLLQVPREDWPFFLAVTREYYYFWVDDFKAIAALNASGGFVMEAAAAYVHNEESFKQIWHRLDNEKFGIAEMWPLKAYRAALREAGAEKSVVETREKLVKLLLIELREVDEKNGKTYRAAVDALQPLFVMKETRQLFLMVVREFYYFWMGDPEAPGHIVLG
jgi:hypothetical protein